MIDDPITETRLKLVCPDIAHKWKQIRVEFYDMNELQMRITCGYRNYADQWQEYAKGRKKDVKGQWTVVDPKKIVTHARGGESFHNFGLAIDIAFMGDDPYLSKYATDDFNFLWGEYGALCQKYGLEWGGNWTPRNIDRPHCEKSYGLELSSLQMIYEEHGIKGIFEKCSQIMGCGREAE